MKKTSVSGSPRPATTCSDTERWRPLAARMPRYSVISRGPPPASASSSYFSQKRGEQQDGNGDEDDQRIEHERRQAQDEGLGIIEQRDSGPDREEHDGEARCEKDPLLQGAMVQQL